MYVRDPDRADESRPATEADPGAFARAATIGVMEGSGFGNMFGDPDDLQRRLGEFAEQIRSVMAVVFPEAVTLVREAREGLQ